MSKDEKRMGIEPEKYREVPDVPRTSRGRKSTKRWCKGKIGRDHTPLIQLATRYGHSKRTECTVTERPSWWGCIEEEVCSTCGKILRWTLGDDCSARK